MRMMTMVSLERNIMELLRTRCERVASDLDRRKGQRDLIAQSIAASESSLAILDSQLSMEREVARLFQLTTEASWAMAKQLVEELVTRALQSVFFDRSYKFAMSYEVKRGAAAVTFAVIENGQEMDLVDDLGGGIADVVALILRIAFVNLYRPRIRQLLILDEPTRMVAAVYQEKVAAFLKQVCKELGMTIFLVTHSAELSNAADQLFRATNIDGVCVVEEEMH